MTTYHQWQGHSDGSVSVKVFAGGPWKVLRGADDGGVTDYYACMACQFVAEQNQWVGKWHRESVTRVRREGRP